MGVLPEARCGRGWRPEPLPLRQRRRVRVVRIKVKSACSVSNRDLRGLRFLADRLGDRFLAGFVLLCMSEITPLGDRMTALPIEALWRATTHR